MSSRPEADSIESDDCAESADFAASQSSPSRPSEDRPPSVDALARALADGGCSLPHALLVDIARAAIAQGAADQAGARAASLARELLTPVVNATGVLLHTNLGRAPLPVVDEGRAANLELSLADGRRGRRAEGVTRLVDHLVGSEASIVVNNGAAAVLLVLAAIASGRDVAVSRGESVEIGGGFRIPEVLAQSGARLVDVGTTNRTRVSDFQAAVDDPDLDVAFVLRVHASNFRVEGFTATPPFDEPLGLQVPVVADLGSGLLDATTPWLRGGPPPWLASEPAARQALAAGVDLVTFSGDKLLGGPQAGIIAGRADLVARCAAHPLYRALRPGRLVLAALQAVLLAHLARDLDRLPFWKRATTPLAGLRARAEHLAASLGPDAEVVDTEALPGAGSVPGVAIASVGVAIGGDRLAALRNHTPPVIARVDERGTVCDLRTVDPEEDPVLEAALHSALVAGGETQPTRGDHRTDSPSP